MSRRTRAIGFGAAALACAGLASQLGPLRPVVVAARALPRRRPLTPATVRAALELRRIPARFVPPGALAAPAQALGQAPAAPIPAGAYLLAPQLRPPRSGGGSGPASGLGPGREPVEIAVSGAGALAAVGGDPVGRGVDVIVTAEPRGAAATGRTYVAAAGIRLLALRQSASPSAGTGSPVGAGGWTATLALTRRQALKLIGAESFAREIRLIGAAR
jgi:Flp pilus assembly protein CpaB